jgi:hypothetical protein
MSRPAPPPITVCSGAWQRTFAPGNDVVIGRDVRADVRVPDPLVSRAHVMLRCLDGRWVAIDNESRNGIFVGHQRVHSVDIRDGETISIGSPEGPRLTLELAPMSRLREEQNGPMSRLREEQNGPMSRLREERNVSHSGSAGRSHDGRAVQHCRDIDARPLDGRLGGRTTGVHHDRPCPR